jgi:hypothetical protein
MVLDDDPQMQVCFFNDRQVNRSSSQKKAKPSKRRTFFGLDESSYSSEVRSQPNLKREEYIVKELEDENQYVAFCSKSETKLPDWSDESQWVNINKNHNRLFELSEAQVGKLKQ